MYLTSRSLVSNRMALISNVIVSFWNTTVGNIPFIGIAIGNNPFNSASGLALLRTEITILLLIEEVPLLEAEEIVADSPDSRM